MTGGVWGLGGTALGRSLSPEFRANPDVGKRREVSFTVTFLIDSGVGVKNQDVPGGRAVFSVWWPVGVFGTLDRECSLAQEPSHASGTFLTFRGLRGSHRKSTLALAL